MVAPEALCLTVKIAIFVTIVRDPSGLEFEAMVSNFFSQNVYKISRLYRTFATEGND